MRIESTGRRPTRRLSRYELIGFTLALLAVALSGCVPGELRLAQDDAGVATPDARGDSKGDSHADATQESALDAKDPEAAHPCTGKCPVILASGRTEPLGIALDDQRVYWTEYGGGNVVACLRQGCAGQPEIIAQGQAGPTAIAVYATQVVWTNATGGQVMMSDQAGGGKGSVEIATGQGSPSSISADQFSVWWTNTSSGELMLAYPSLSTQAFAAASAQNRPINHVRNGNAIWWLNRGSSPDKSNGEVRAGSWAQSGLSQAQPLATGLPGPSGIAFDNGVVYWTTLGAGPNTGEIWASDNGYGGQTTLLAHQQGEPVSIAVGNDRLYWTNSASGQIMSCKANGCGMQPTVLASGGATPWAIARDSSSIFWTDPGAGQVLRLDL